MLTSASNASNGLQKTPELPTEAKTERLQKRIKETGRDVSRSVEV